MTEMIEMKEYNILNTVKPKFLRTQYPYNLLDPKKILMTQKKITILAKSFANKKEGGVDKSFATKKEGDAPSSNNPITFYG